jgi:penicillin G amidase
MATSTVPASSSPVHFRWGRLIAGAVLVFLLAILIALGLLYRFAHSALPQLDGELKVPGLTAPVTVIRDTHGVPTIEATNLPDLFFAQGYVTAQDRLWQMDGMRRFAAGELSEVFGEGQLEHDRTQRILGLRMVSARALEMASPRDRSFFEAYTRGVNAYIQTHQDRLPIEFRILGYHPKPWTVEDCFLMGANMVENLNHGVYREALLREKVLAGLGPELTADLFINTSFHDRPPTQPPPRLGRLEPEPLPRAHNNITQNLVPRSISPTPEPLENLQLLRPGSNNWVVSGQHTVSGKPLLSNDMHLSHQMPNLWYEVHLKSGDFNVIGVSLPGLPFVVVGHNQRIVWGFTNVGPNAEDVYVESFNDKGQYLTPKGWRDPEHRTELIHVKGKRDETLDVTITRHGPIITDLVPGEKRKLALRWTLYDGLRDPFFDVDSAQNWQQFTDAISTWDAPAQNAVYGDVDGHIGYHATGHIPIRASGDGSLPEDGSNDAHEWKGYIPFDKLPNIYDPPWGVIATANARITPDDYPYSISTAWDAPWRTERIYRVLESGKKFSPSDMLQLQTDIYSAIHRYCAERLVYALDHAPKLSTRAAQARDLMRDWDGKVTPDSAAAIVEYRSMVKLVRMLLEPKIQAAQQHRDSNVPPLTIDDMHWSRQSVWMENILIKRPQRWLPPNYSDYDAAMVDAVEATVNSADAPADPKKWTQQTNSVLRIQHPILGRIPIIRRWSGPGEVRQSGAGSTVKQVGTSFGPSERLTVDFSDLDQSTLNVVTGQGGNFLSPYYMDQWKAWYEGFTFTLPFSDAAIEKTKAHRLELTPQT